MPFKDKEQAKAYNKAKYEERKDKLKAWYEANKEQAKAYSKAYRQANKEKEQHRSKAYSKTEQGKKVSRMSKWRSYGVNNVTDELYDYYMNCDKCEVCGKEFAETIKKCLDHDHDTGDFRFVLCYSCNTRDSWKKKI